MTAASTGSEGTGPPGQSSCWVGGPAPSDSTAASPSREARLERVVRWLLSGKAWGAFIATPEHPAGTGWTLEDEAKEALNG